MSTMQPFLMSQDGHAEKGAEGGIKLAPFRAAGQSVLAGDSPVKHVFDFTPSWSYFVDCASAEEQRRLSPNCRMVAGY